MTVHPLIYPHARILMHEWSFYIFSRCQTTMAMGQVFVKTSLPKQMLTDFSIWQDIICARGQVSVPREFCLQHKSKSYRARPKQKALIHLRVPLFKWWVYGTRNSAWVSACLTVVGINVSLLCTCSPKQINHIFNMEQKLPHSTFSFLLLRSCKIAFSPLNLMLISGGCLSDSLLHFEPIKNKELLRGLIIHTQAARTLRYVLCKPGKVAFCPAVLLIYHEITLKYILILAVTGNYLYFWYHLNCLTVLLLEKHTCMNVTNLIILVSVILHFDSSSELLSDRFERLQLSAVICKSSLLFYHFTSVFALMITSMYCMGDVVLDRQIVIPRCDPIQSHPPERLSVVTFTQGWVIHKERKNMQNIVKGFEQNCLNSHSDILISPHEFLSKLCSSSVSFTLGVEIPTSPWMSLLCKFSLL